MSRHHPCIPVSYAHTALAVVEARKGGAALSALASVLPAEALADPAALLSMDAFDTFMREVQRLGSDDGICWELGLSAQLARHGALGFALAASASLAEALQVGVQFLGTRTPYFRLATIKDGHDTLILVQPTTELGDLTAFAFATTVTAIAILARSLQPAAATSITMHLTQAPDPGYSHWREQLPEVQFGSPFDGVRIPDRLLNLPLPGRAIPLTASARHACEEALRAHEPGLIATLHQVLDTLPASAHHLETVARRMAVSPRTLRRQLAAEGKRFKELLQERRQQQAERLLANGRTVADIAEALGYADESHFIRAYRQWTGVTPGARKKLPPP